MNLKGHIGVQVPIIPFAVAFGEMDNHTQAEVLNAMGKAVRSVGPSDYHAEMQLCYILDDLNADGVWLANTLVELKAERDKR